MKKLMIIAAAVLCGTFAHAAAINWQITNATAAQTGYSVYMVAAISDAWTSGADVAADAAALGSGTSGTIAKSGRNYMIPSTTAAGDGITASSSLYLVLVKSSDAKDYTYVSMGDVSGSVYEPPAAPSGNFSMTSAALLAGTSGNFAAVPEPTSGLLMLLGVAGLALRRRRA